MAKLYAELTSDKGGRVASKGGDTTLKVSLNHQNKNFGIVDAYIWQGKTLKVFYNNVLLQEIKLK